MSSAAKARAEGRQAVAVVDDEARPAREAGIIRTDAGEAGRELAAWLVENKLV